MGLQAFPWWFHNTKVSQSTTKEPIRWHSLANICQYKWLNLIQAADDIFKSCILPDGDIFETLLYPFSAGQFFCRNSGLVRIPKSEPLGIWTGLFTGRKTPSCLLTDSFETLKGRAGVRKFGKRLTYRWRAAGQRKQQKNSWLSCLFTGLRTRWRH